LGLKGATETNAGDQERLPQDDADMLNWDEQVREVARVFNRLAPSTMRRTASRWATITAAIAAGACDLNGTGPGGEIAGVVIEAPSLHIRALGAEVRLVAKALNANGDVLEGRSFVWSSANPAVATIDGAGTVTGIANGVVRISANAGGITGTADVTVRQVAAAATILTAPVAGIVGVPFATQPVLELFDEHGNPMPADDATTLRALVLDGPGVVAGDTVAAALAGTVRFTTLSVVGGVGHYRLGFTGDQLDTVATDSLPVAVGPAVAGSSLVTTSASFVTVGASVTITLTGHDAGNNVATAGGGTVQFFAIGGSSIGTLTTAVDLGNGTYTALFVGVVAGFETTIRAILNGDTVPSFARVTVVP